MDTTTIAQTMERDIARLKSARPRLTSRIERAKHILVTQLSTANGSRPVKIRVHADGSRSYTVRSGSKLCRSYLVDQRSWECECPDHRRRRAACKHALACWVMERAYRSSPEPLGTEEGELLWLRWTLRLTGPYRAPRGQPRQPDLLPRR